MNVPVASISFSRCVAVAVMLGLTAASQSVAWCGPIHKATLKGDQARVVALLKQNPEVVNSRDKFGNMPLHIAALHNKVAIAELLLANGANVNARNVDATRVPRKENAGETPLTLALQPYQHKEMLEMLLTHGADPNVMLSWGTTPLHWAVEHDLPYDVELLLANGADPDAKGFNWETPVHVAVYHDKVALLRLLLNYGANPNAKNIAGKTPLYYSRLYSHPKAGELLRTYGAHE